MRDAPPGDVLRPATTGGVGPEPAARAHRAKAAWTIALLLAGVPACGSHAASPHQPSGEGALDALAEGPLGRIEVRKDGTRPRLTLVSRDGDPAPAVAIAVATDLGPIATVALAGLVEARLRAAGFAVDSRSDRDGFRIRWSGAEAPRTGAFVAAAIAAFQRPVAPGSSDVATASQRVQALRRHPLEAPELVPVAACTGRLGAGAAEPSVDPNGPAFASELERWRRAALHAGRASIAAVGPTAFCAAMTAAVDRAPPWPQGAPAADAWAKADAYGAYATHAVDRRGARASIALRVADPRVAIAAAERIGAADSPLRARLGALPEPWRAVEVTGTARPRGGCIAVTIEAAQPIAPGSLDGAAARAIALVQHELRIELADAADPLAAARQILTAADPREAAGRAAWWALSGAAGESSERWAVALGTAPDSRGAPAVSTARLAAALDRARAPAAPIERRFAVERGQGELWLLLASPCGSADEVAQDAGATGLSLLSALASDPGRSDGVRVEPWITPDGIGVIAHAAPRDAAEAPAELARRVGDAAARVLVAASPSLEGLAAARAAVLDRIDRASGRQGAALERFALAVAPEHPSWLDPLGTWTRVAGASVETLRFRWQALAEGPLRLAVVANADLQQAQAAAAAVDRWLSVRRQERTCEPASASPHRPGRYTATLPPGTELAQVLVGLPVPPRGTPGYELAELTALALDGPDGLLAPALSSVGVVAGASARVTGGSRAAALIVDVRVPSEAVETTVTDVKALLARLARGAATDADFARAAGLAARRERNELTQPRRRLVDLWSARAPTAIVRPTAVAWREWLAATLREASLVIVEAKPD